MAKLLLILFSCAPLLAAQVASAQGVLRVRVTHEAGPVTGAYVRAGTGAALTDASGRASLALPDGTYRLTIERIGFATYADTVTVTAGRARDLVVELVPQPIEEEVIVASVGRSGRIIQDQPIRVEAVPQEEVEEESTTAPGAVTTMLQETAGARLVAQSAALGGATLRLRGLPGRYSQVLVDQLPQLGTSVDGFSLLQLPPVDLAQVEVMKGVATVLYGGSAIGGVLNLVSKQTGESAVLLSRSSRTTTDGSAFLLRALSPNATLTLTGGAHAQAHSDLDHDGWSDLPAYDRYEIRPRLFLKSSHGNALFVTAGHTRDVRRAFAPTFREEFETKHWDAGATGRLLMRADRMVFFRTALTDRRQERASPNEKNSHVQRDALFEIAASGSNGAHHWIGGAALTSLMLRDDRIEPISDRSVGIFAQDEFTISETLSMSAAARRDFSSHFPARTSLRAAALQDAGSWQLRLSAGFAETPPLPNLEEDELPPYAFVQRAPGLRNERASVFAFDVGRNTTGLEVNVSVFRSRIARPLEIGVTNGIPVLFNDSEDLKAMGTEFVLRYVRGWLHLIANHTYADVNRDRSPKHAGEIAIMFERERMGRAGIEVSFTGRQALKDNPYLRQAPAFVEINALFAKSFGESAVFVNFLNITDRRLTRYHPFPRRAPSPLGELTTRAWMPLSGRVINAGVRLDL